MPPNNLTQLPSVELLIQRVTNAERMQQKDIRLSITEGRQLINELALMTAQMNANIQNINKNLERIAASTETIEVKFDGGGFRG